MHFSSIFSVWARLGLLVGVNLIAAFAAHAQIAPDTTGVSVAVEIVGIDWQLERGPESYVQIQMSALNGLQTRQGDFQTMMPRMVVGKTYNLAVSGSGYDGIMVQAVPPAGYIMEIEGVARERFYAGASLGIGLRVRPRADAAPARAGMATALGAERTLWQASLGSLSTGESAGAIGFIDSGTTSSVATLFTPNGLIYDPPSSDVLVKRNPSNVAAPYVPGTLRQIIAPQVCVDVFMDSSNQCQLKFYHRAQLGTLSGGIYSFTGDPFAWYFFNQTGANTDAVTISCDLRNITATDGTVLAGGQPVSRTKITKLVRSGTGPNFTWTANDWFKSGETTLTDMVRARSGTTETLTVAPHSGTAISQLTRSYAVKPWGEEVTQETRGTSDSIVTTYDYWDMTAHGGDQSNVHTRLKSRLSHGSWEAWEYYDHEEGDALSGRIRKYHRPYKNSDTSVPATHASAPDALVSHTGEVTSYTWGLDVFGRGTRPTSVETKVNGVTTSKVETSYAGPSFVNFTGHAALTIMTATRKDYSATGNYLTTITKYFSEHSGANGAPATDDFFRLRLHSVQRPDGVKQSFAYQRGTWSYSTGVFTLSGNSGLDVPSDTYGSRVSVITGVATGGTTYSTHNGYDIDDLGLIDGKSTLSVTIRDNYARIVRTESYVRSANAWALVGAVNYRWNNSNQLIERASNPSETYDLANGAIYKATYDGEYLKSETDETGIVMTYDYDTADRVDTVTKATATSGSITIPELVTKFIYDAAGRVTEQQVGYGQAEKIITSRTFDMAGRLATVSSPGPNGAIQSTYTYTPGSRQVKVTQPLGRDRTETFFADGSTQNVTGTAVVPQYFDYEIRTGGVRYGKVAMGSTGASRYRETWADWLGRTTQTSRPGFANQNTFIETADYDVTNGRLNKTTSTGFADTFYGYDALSQLTRTLVDVNANQAFDDTIDRTTESDRFFEKDANNAWWLKTVAKVYAQAGSNATRTVSTTLQRLTGFEPPAAGELPLLAETQSIDVDGNTTTRKTFVDRAHAMVTIKTTTSGVTNTQTETLINGLATSVTGVDGLTYTTTYDGLGRPWKTKDPRHLQQAEISYKSGSTFVAWTKDAAGNYTATYTYDAAGRVIGVANAAGKVTRTEYNTLDQVIRQWGNATHPVEYGYNNLGERITMKTFREGSGWEGISSNVLLDWPSSTVGTADWTRWDFDEYSGLLKAKYDGANLNASGQPIANAKKVAYTYNARGQLQSRTWARGVTTNYAYFGDTTGDLITGELKSESYTDGTPSVSYTYTRAGQLKTVRDATSSSATDLRTFQYGIATPSTSTHALQLDRIDLPAYYNSRQISRSYDSIHRPTGFAIGTELSQTYGYVAATGRFDHVETASAAQSSRTFTYGYNGGGLVSGLSVAGSSFNVAYAYEDNRDLLQSIDSKWESASRTRYDYIYNGLGQRYTAKQSGDVFGDFGTATYYRHVYNDRGELESSADYLGNTPTALGSEPTVADQLPSRNFRYTYDNAGNRKTTSRNGTTTGAGTETYSTATTSIANGALNQYSSRTNNYSRAAGTVASTGPGATESSITVTTSGGGLVWSSGQKGRFWASDGQAANNAPPAVTPVTITATRPGSPALVRTDATHNLFVLPQTQTFSYDEDGNLTGDGLWKYSYDAENRLVAMEIDPTLIGFIPAANARRLQFQYDYLHRRVQKVVLGWNATAYGGTPISQRRYLYDGNNLVAELSGDGITVKRSFTWGLDLAGSLTATGGVGALTQITDHNGTPASYFVTYDGNGNVAALLGTDGSVAAKYEYSPVGELLRAEGTYAKENPFRFSTKFADDETGLVYYGARYYSPSLGRFINRDPIEEAGGLNLYGFCGNDGVNGFDYLGYQNLTPEAQEAINLLNPNAGAGNTGTPTYDDRQPPTTPGITETFPELQNAIARIASSTVEISYGGSPRPADSEKRNVTTATVPRSVAAPKRAAGGREDLGDGLTTRYDPSYDADVVVTGGSVFGTPVHVALENYRRTGDEKYFRIAVDMAHLSDGNAVSLWAFQSAMADVFDESELRQLLRITMATEGPGIATGVAEAGIGALGSLKIAVRPNGKLPRYEGDKPRYTNPGTHDPKNPNFVKGKTPLPADAEAIYRGAVPESPTGARQWYGRDTQGRYYRFSDSNDGTGHFSGIVDEADVPTYAKARLKGK